MKEHEYRCILSGMQLSTDELISYDMFERGGIKQSEIDKYDAVIVGGSGDFSVYDSSSLPFLDELKGAVRYCYEKNIPFLGICFGIQLAAVAFGGTVQKIPEQKEAGSFKIYLTAAGKNSPIFADMPDEFYAVTGHMDSVTALPASARLLAKSDLCPIHAFDFPEKKFFVFQFHPELDKNGLVERLTFYYKKGYARQDEIDDIVKNAHEAPETKKILYNFKRMI